MAVDRSTIRGLATAGRVFRALPAETREAYVELAVEPTASEIARNAAGRLRPGHGLATGQLQRALGYQVNRRSGSAKVGVRRGFDVFTPGRNGSASTRAGARAHRPTKIGHLVEFGHGGRAPAEAHPFIVPAAEAEQPYFLQRARVAGKSLETRLAALAARGSRFE